MTSLRNLHTVNPTGNAVLDKSIEQLFDTMFDKDIISIGSFVRKVYVILMGLCDIVSGLWVVTLRYD